MAAQLENLSGAAAALYITQSSLSKNIASLEKELGMQLFDRKGKSLKLNEAGAHFLVSCQRMLGEFDEAMDQMSQFDGKQDVHLHVGVDGDLGPLLSWMADFRTIHPEAVFEIDSSLGSQSHPDINAYDLMVYPAGRKYTKFKGYPFFTESFFLAVPAGDPLTVKGLASNRDLSGRDYVFLRCGEEGNEYPYEVCRSLMVETRSEHMVDSELMKRKIILEGIACGFVSAEQAELYRNERQVWLLPLVSSRFTRQMMICFKRKKHLSALADEFCSYIRTCAALTEEE